MTLMTVTLMTGFIGKKENQMTGNGRSLMISEVSGRSDFIF